MEKLESNKRFPLSHSHDDYELHTVMGYGFQGQGQLPSAMLSNLPVLNNHRL